jgi:hypothetical protein
MTTEDIEDLLQASEESNLLVNFGKDRDDG